MKSILAAVLTLTVAVLTWTQQVVAQEAEGPSPVEAFFCNMQDGKTMKDLMQVADRFAKWADKNDPDYSAWILTPRFAQFATTSQVVWLGSNPDGNSMGKGLDQWVTKGNDLQEAFDEVIMCMAHGLASSVEINAPDGPPGDGVVMFTECSFAEGSDPTNAWDNVLKAHKTYSEAMRSMGAKNSNWLFFPMLGGDPERDFDYWGVSTFNSWSDYFAAYELYVSGGWKKGMAALNDVATCNVGSPTVWDVKLVRSGAS
jgi:hypothetical protein